MTFKEFKKKPIVKFMSNRYVMIIVLFLVWMLFFDENSFLNHHELNKEIDKLEKSTEYYEKNIRKCKFTINCEFSS